MAHKFSCIIIDDEYQAIELLSDHLNVFFKQIEIKGKYTDWAPALDAVRSNTYDLIFMDITIHDKNGMDIVRLVSGLNAEIIFVTAHTDYALSAYKLMASGYLVKPIDEAEFIATVDNALRRAGNKKAANTQNILTVRPRIGIPNNNAIDYIDTCDILYLEAQNSYTKIIAKNKEVFSSYNIGKFKAFLDEPIFYQVHRSYVINLNYIKRYEITGIIIMENGKEIPVSKSERPKFLNLFNKLR